MAGAVNITTASPDLEEEFNGNVAFTAETNDGYIGEGVLSGALTDDVSARLAFRYRETEGFVDNTFLNQDEPEIEETVIRGTLVWQPTENLDANIKYSYAEYDRDGVGSGSWLYLDAEERAEQVPNASAFADIAYLITDTVYPEFAERAGDEFDIFKDNGLGPDKQGVGIGINPESSDNDIDNFAMTLNYYWGD